MPPQVFFFLPIGLDEQAVNRLPWVTISIALTCVLAFLGTFVFHAPAHEGPFRDAARYWAAHPKLNPRPEFKAMAGERFVTAVERSRTEQTEDPTDEEQALLDQKVSDALIALEHNPLRRYALVPARGLAQPGWLTSLFLHFGWLHLIFNLVFLYIVAPFLEDAWGRPVFLGFYLAGGLAGGLAQYSADPHSTIAVAGASGAIAACVGAFMLRFATRRVRTFYFIWLVRPFVGTVLLRAWLWGLLWIGAEVYSLAAHGATGGGVAVLAHIGGFAFGAVFAAGLKASGIEKKHLAPAVEAKVEGWSLSPGVVRAQEALAAGDRAAARRSYQEAIAAAPGDRDAALGLAKLELEEGRVEAGSRLLERGLASALTQNDVEAVRNAVEDLGSAYHPESVKPAVAYRMAQALEAAGLAFVAERTYAAAGGAPGNLGPKALIRAAELRLASHTDVKQAAGYLDRLGAIDDVPTDVTARAAEIRQAMDVHGTPGGGRHIELSEAPAHAAAGPATVRVARLVALAPDAMEVEDELKRALRIAWREVQAVAVAVIPVPEAQGKNLILTDLVLSWGTHDGGRASVMRFSGAGLALATLYPGVPSREAYGRLLQQLFEASGASGLPDKDELLKGNYPRYPDVAAFETACYASLV